MLHGGAGGGSRVFKQCHSLFIVLLTRVPRREHEETLENQPQRNGGFGSGPSTQVRSEWLCPELLRIAVETPQLHDNRVTDFWQSPSGFAHP